MLINSLNAVKKTIKKNIFISLITLLVLSLLITNAIYYLYMQNMKQENHHQLLSNFDLLKYNISEKLSIVTSSDIFINYLRSGLVSQSSFKSDFLFEIKQLKTNEISGIQILTKKNKEFFFDGEKSPYFVSLPLCYLDRNLNSNLGDCTHNIILYFNINEIIKNLLKINTNLKICSKCKPNNFLMSKKFGSFLVTKSSNMPLYLNIKNSQFFNILLINFLVLIILIILAIWIWTWQKINLILERYISYPINQITKQLKNGKALIKSNKINELTYLIDQIQEREVKLKAAKKNEKMVAIGLMASQVAHDIRSPLAALNAIVKQTQDISEKPRIMIRNATQQINDIANNLLEQYKNNKIDNHQTSTPELIALLLDIVISEKRAQYNHLPIHIEFTIANDSHGVFANVPAINFKRMVSNLINNAVEAIQLNKSNAESNNTITLTLSTCHQDQLIKIDLNDTGPGMSKDLINKILDGNAVSNKKSGHGIGLSTAQKYIQQWKGKLNIESKLHHGTTIHITLPLISSPNWFCDKLTFSPNDKIIVLDDDQSIHDIWQSRIESEISKNYLTLIHYYHPDDLLNADLNTINANKYLCDYEIIGNNLSGLDVIEKLHLSNKATLVTSRHDDIHIRERCKKMGVKILPKNFAPYVPLLVEEMRLDNINKIIKPDLILIDDNRMLTTTWKFTAEISGKKIVIFNTIAECEQNIHQYDSNSLIYIDSDLGNQIKGEDYAKTLYDKNFKNIYLSTGYDAAQFDLKKYYWIKGVVGKDLQFNF